MRGNHFINILKHIDTIENVLQTLIEKPNSTTKDFKDLTLTFKNVAGLGLSTYSKLLYFFKIAFNDNPCLILDQRLIDVFVSKTYSNFRQIDKIRYYNSDKQYLDYLQIVKITARKLETKGENIEQFLFTYGNNLKVTKTNERKPDR